MNACIAALAKKSIGKFLGPKSVPEIDHNISKCERSYSQN